MVVRFSKANETDRKLRSTPTLKRFLDEYLEWLIDDPEHRDAQGTVARLRACFGGELVAFDAATKGPNITGWYQRAINPERIGNRNFGVIHGLTETCSIDLDDLDRALAILETFGLDYDELVEQTFAWKGQPDRAKLLFRIPPGATLPNA